MSNATESVWDYPRPPRLEPTRRHLRIVHAGAVIADTRSAFRILETSHPPVYYLPPQDVAMHLLRPSARRGSFCEFKGTAIYWDLDISKLEVISDLPSATEASQSSAVRTGRVSPVVEVAWSYASPAGAYTALKDHLAFYAGRVEECTVDGERVLPQPGDFYGGWITSDLRGPFKGAPGTGGW